MKYRTLLTVFPILAAFALSACGQGIDITITVVDEEGTPMEGAYVRTGYTLRDGSDRIIEAHTDAGGRVNFKARPPGYQYLKALVKHEGYYDSYAQFSITQPAQGGFLKQSDTDTTFTLREIRDPVPMYARQLDMDLLVVGDPVGFDLFVHDWVAPHGGGSHADILFELSGDFRDRLDQNSILRMSFPGEGNGMIAFDKSQYDDSEFKSPYIAPADGYRDEWTFRKLRYPNPERRAGQPRVIIEDSQDPNRAYIFRIRAEHDAEGNPIGGYYGKIMGDIDFAGATDVGSFIRSGTLYLNPTTGDRNLEMDVERNLATDLDRRIRPLRLKP